MPEVVRRFDLAADYSIARVVNGGWQLSLGHRLEGGESSREETVAGLVKMAQAGFTTFDCADIYTGVEELFGEVRSRYISEGGRAEDLQIHTKFVPDRSALGSVDRDYVEAVVDRSLTRLGVERLDLVQFHWWDYEVPGAVDAAGHLADLQAAGKVRLIGATNFDTPHLDELVAAGIPVVTHQVQYSLLDRRPDNGMRAYCRSKGIALLCYGALAGGYLTDRYAGGRPLVEESRSHTKYRLIIEEYGGEAAYRDLLVALGKIANRHGVGIAAVASRFVLERPGVAAVIIGARSAAHLEKTAEVFGFRLDPWDYDDLTQAFARSRPVPGDTFNLEREDGGRHRSIMKTDLNRLT